jgi:hypothetical protein
MALLEFAMGRGMLTSEVLSYLPEVFVAFVTHRTLIQNKTLIEVFGKVFVHRCRLHGLYVEHRGILLEIAALGL